MAILRYVIFAFKLSFLYLPISFLLLFSHAKAEIISATGVSGGSPSTVYLWNGAHFDYSDSGQDAACKSRYGSSAVRGANRGYCLYYGANYAAPDTISWCLVGDISPVNGSCPGSYTCPSTGGWTLSGSSCTRPDCKSYMSRSPDTGVCVCPNPAQTDNGTMCATQCPSGYHNRTPDNGQCEKDCLSMQRQGADGVCVCDVKGYTTTSSGSDFGVGCLGGCSLSWGAGYMNPGGPALFTSSTWTNINPSSTVYAYVRQTGATCQTDTGRLNVTLTKLPQDTSGKAADGVTSDPLNKPETNQSPDACASVGGSFAVVNGKSACLTDTANKMDKLTVNQKTTVTTNPDGTSTKVTDSVYKQTDSVTGETKIGTTTTTQTIGVNGTVTGTGTSTGVSTGSGGGSGSGSGAGGDSSSGDLCKNNPGLDVCNNRLNKEETQVKIKDSLSAEGFDPATHLPDTLDASAAAKKEATDKVADIVADVEKFGTGADPASSKYDQFRDAMGSWFDPIPASGCSPFSARIGPWTWNFDHCPTAYKIAEIGAYCMWVMLAFGVFALVTKEGK